MTWSDWLFCAALVLFLGAAGAVGAPTFADTYGCGGVLDRGASTDPYGGCDGIIDDREAFGLRLLIGAGIAVVAGLALWRRQGGAAVSGGKQRPVLTALLMPVFIWFVLVSSADGAGVYNDLVDELVVGPPPRASCCWSTPMV